MEPTAEFKFHHQTFVRSTSLPYCGSETESELYAPYGFYTGDEVLSLCSFIAKIGHSPSLFNFIDVRTGMAENFLKSAIRFADTKENDNFIIARDFPSGIYGTLLPAGKFMARLDSSYIIKNLGNNFTSR